MTTETPTVPSTEGSVITPTTAINFLGLDGLPIAHLDVLIKVGEQEYQKTTDAEGGLPIFRSASETPIEVFVKRMDGSYKLIDSCTTSSADACWTYTSPALVLETKTQPHAGEPGQIEAQIPRFETGDAGVVSKEPVAAPAVLEPEVSPSYRDEGRNQPAPNATAITTATAAKPTSKKLPDPQRAAAPKTGASAPLVTGRNSKGEPVTVYTEKSRDWWGRWLMSTLHFFGGGEANAAQAKPSSLAGKAGVSGGTSGKPGASKAASAASAIAIFDTTVAYNGSMSEQVKHLIEIATEQTSYEITGGTHNFLAKEKNGTKKLKDYPTKRSDDAKGYCYAYVKIALMRANIIDTPPGNEAASEAGHELLSRGFIDVTDSVPDPRWAAAGDVIVYAWSAQVLESERRRDAYAKKVKVYKAKGKKVDFKLADVSPADSNKPNFGHIDIRSYDGYISDHIPQVVVRGKPAQMGEPNWLRYNAYPRIYRKVFDPMPTLRIMAFLRCLREYECTTERDDAKRFNMLNAALPSNPQSRRFDSYKSHPWEGNGNPASGSTAAGAYQIVYGTWKEKFDRGLIAVPAGKDKFSPEVQNRIAVMKLYDRGALNFIRKGDIEKAIADTSLPNEWSSLPGGKENAKRISADGKSMNMEYFLSLFNQYLDDEKRKANL